ncbi:MAG: 3-deoxy-manno-octulosonate cytidylyltransferase [Gammaproteobacteria bacterium]|nr:MAG: 3-deoxy-manno-octulosonate cytidylyltransferase [Gammaproteobacteria bacterium]
MNTIIVIPARYDSTRFPGKPLAMIGNKSMLQHVYERACNARASKIIIATDDARIEAAAKAFGADVCMTSPDHQSGTERIAEVVEKYGILDHTIVINLQGDEPFIPPTMLNQVADLLQLHPDCGMSTLCHRIETRDEIFNPHTVKVVMDKDGYALTFSRAPIPWNRHVFDDISDGSYFSGDYFRHIGLYAYTAGFLKQYIQMEPCEIEKIEGLEQLRVLWHGEKIRVGITDDTMGIGIDTPEDLELANTWYSHNG